MRSGRKGMGFRAAARHVALLLSFGVLLLSQLAAMGHLVLVRHSICEHGAVVHGEEHARATPGSVQRDDGQAVDQGERAERAHEHCDPSGIKPALVEASVYCLTPTLLDGYLLPWSLRPQDADAPVALLLLAPKSSPPV